MIRLVRGELTIENRMLRFDQVVVVNRTDGLLVQVVLVQFTSVAHHHGNGCAVRVGQRWRRLVQVNQRRRHTRSLALMLVMMMIQVSRMAGHDGVSCRTSSENFSRSRVSLPLTFTSLPIENTCILIKF